MFVPCADCPMRQLPSFRSNEPQEIEFIQSFKQAHRALPSGSTLVHEGHAVGELFTLFSGWAFRYCTLSDGRRQILNFLLPGDFFGLQERLNEQSPHGVEALTDVELCVFPAAGLWDLFKNHPGLGYDVTWLAAHEERIVDMNLVSVGRRSAAERVAMLLIHLHKRATLLGLVDESGGVPFPMNQSHLADALGLSLVHTNKTMSRLRRLELYALHGGRLYLPQPHALQQLADYYESPLPPRPLV